MTLYDDYKNVYETIQLLSKFLIKQLSKCEIEETPDKSFDYLIERVADINAIIHTNSNNTPPDTKPEIITNKTLTDFNISLAQRIRYYEKRLAYLLVLKGVSELEVNNCTSLAELINLIDKVDIVRHSTLKLPTARVVNGIHVLPRENYGYSIPILYELKDSNGDEITQGNIELKCDGVLYQTITAGKVLTFTPPSISKKENGEYVPYNLEITYTGTKKYQTSTIKASIVIIPGNIELETNIINVTETSKYINNNSIGSEGDNWQITVNTFCGGNSLANIPLLITILNDTDTIEEIETITDEKGKSVINYAINQVGNYLINIESKYENTNELINTKTQHSVTIKYNILYQQNQNYTKYAGKTNTYIVEIHNEETNEIDTTYDGQIILCIDNDDTIPLTIQNGEIAYEKESLSATEFELKWILEQNNFTVSSITTVNILSNFTLPDTVSFYLNNTPEIIYHPLGNISINKKVQVDIDSVVLKTEYSESIIDGEIQYEKNSNGEYILDDNGDKIPILIETTYEEFEDYTNELYYTNTNGLLHKFNTLLLPGKYKVKLTTNSDDLNETIYYTYELKVPLKLNLIDYQKKSYAKYNLMVYDIDNIDNIKYTLINNSEDITGLDLLIKSSNPQIINNYININLEIPLSEETNGTNIIQAELNEYIVNDSFKLFSKYFELLTESVEIGESQVKILCNDDDIIDIKIEDLDDLFIDNIYRIYDEEKKAYIFVVDILSTATGLKDLTIISNDGEEEITLNIIKKDLTNYININFALLEDDTVNGDSATIKVTDLEDLILTFRSSIQTYSDINVSYYYKKITDISDTLYYTFDYKTTGGILTSQNNSFLDVNSTLKPGEYVLTFISNGNSNYLPFKKEINLTIIKATPALETKLYTAYNDTDYGQLTLTQETSLDASLTTSLIAQFINQLNEPISNQEITFYINEAPISDITDLTTSTVITDETGTASVSYTNLNEIVINIRVATKNQCSNVIVVNTIENILSQVENCYIEIVDENNELVIAEKPADDIDNIDDLQGIIVDMGIDSDGNWQYDKFNSSSDNLSADEITQLSNALVGYLDENGELKITLLGDV